MMKLKKEMDLLLEKFLREETSPDEEKTLEIYLSMSNLNPEHEPYRALIKKRKKKKAIIQLIEKAVKRKPYTFSLLARIAAFCLLVLAVVFIIVQIKKTDENIAFVKGEKTTNTEQIEEYAKKRILKIKTILTGSLDPLEDIKNLKIGLEKAETAADLLQHSLDKPLKKLSLKKQKDEKINNSNASTDTINNSKRANP